MVDQFEKFPTLNQLFYHTPRGGALIEGRQNRSGATSMEIATWLQWHRISDVKIQQIQIPELTGFNIFEFSYFIEGKSFVDLERLGEIKRYETLGWWQASFQEVLRHLARMPIVEGDILWNEVNRLCDELRDSIIETLEAYLNYILDHGDFSLEHWLFYIKEHEESASPFGPKWKQIGEKPDAARLTLDRTTRWIQMFIKAFRKLIPDGNQHVYINPAYAYPGVRARPAEITMIEQRDYTFRAVARKWRDRKVGGIMGLSQLEFPIYKLPQKKEAVKVFENWAENLLGCPVHMLDLEGPQVFKFLFDHADEVFCYDLHIAEKISGIILKFLPFVCDLGHPLFEGRFAGEMYSGIGPTPWMNFIVIVLILYTLKVMYGIEYKWSCIYSDNFAVNVELPASEFYALDVAFCGCMPKEQRFGPVSLVTDNPDHRLAFRNNAQYQQQSIQYIMRPLLAVIMNGISSYDSAPKLMDYVIENGWEAEQRGYWISDQLKEYVLEKDVDYHLGIQDKFPREVQFVKDHWTVQDRDPDYATNLKVT